MCLPRGVVDACAAKQESCSCSVGPARRRLLVEQRDSPGFLVRRATNHEHDHILWSASGRSPAPQSLSGMHAYLCSPAFGPPAPSINGKFGSLSRPLSRFSTVWDRCGVCCMYTFSTPFRPFSAERPFARSDSAEKRSSCRWSEPAMFKIT